MADHTVTNGDIEALAAKLEGMSDQFTDAERAALGAVFTLAGAGLDAAAADVEGFGGGLWSGKSFELSMGSSQGVLIGLNQAFVGGQVGGLLHKDKISPGDGSVIKFYQKG